MSWQAVSDLDVPPEVTARSASDPWCSKMMVPWSHIGPQDAGGFGLAWGLAATLSPSDPSPGRGPSSRTT